MPTLKEQEVELPVGGYLTDAGNALRIVAAANGHIRFVEAWKSWIVYDEAEGHWVRDDTRARVNEVAKHVSSMILRVGTKESDSDVKKTIIGFALKAENKRAIDAMVDLAKGLPGIIIQPDDIDAKPHLFNVRNGTVDLLTGDLREHDPEDLLMLQAPVFYDKNAKSALWDGCLETWQPNPATRHYLQRVCGTGISGDPVQSLIINIGKGANGKSAAFEAIAAVVGPFKVTPNKKLLTINKQDGHATEIASLKGARLAIAAETADNERLNEASIKNLTGGDTLTARGLYENEWSFRPTHTLFLHTNYQPDIKGTDEGIWRRIQVIPWVVTIDKADRDDRLTERLGTEKVKSAILNWLVEGYRAYRLDPRPPIEVQRATGGYRRDEDVLGMFISERVSEGGGNVTNSRFMEEFGDYCDARGDVPASYVEVTKRLRGLGFKNKRMSAGMCWLGLVLNKQGPEEFGGDVGHVVDIEVPHEGGSGVSTKQPTEPTYDSSLQEYLDQLEVEWYSWHELHAHELE